MFIGHYGVSFAAKAIKPAIPLWVLFLAVQLVDVFWAIFVLLGIEKVRIVPGITATNPLDLYYMPYTHGLVSALLWSIGAAVLYRLFSRLNGWGTAAIVGAAVFSHWLFDLLVHRPDLPLYDDTLKVGFGLWDLPVIAFGLEAALLVAGMFLYARATKPASCGSSYAMIVLALVMAAIQLTVFFGAPPTSGTEVAVSALLAYFLFAAAAYWLERQRRQFARHRSGMKGDGER